MRWYSFRFICLLAALCFLSLTWIILVSRDEVYPGAPVQDLEIRLLLAEEREKNISKDLSIILEQLKNTSKDADITNSTINATTTITTTTINTISSPGMEELPDKPGTETIIQMLDDSGNQMFQPSIYLYLPHLRQQPGSLKPNIVLGQGRRGVSMVLGIPTVKRDKQSYLDETISSLLNGLMPSQQQDLLIIIFVAEIDLVYVNSVAETIRSNFPKEVQMGLLEIISPSAYYYPDFSTLGESLGDSKDRIKWRTKQNLDFSFLMLYAQDKGAYYVQLEDDIVAKSGYYNDMKTFATQEASKPWLYLEFSQLGFIGKLFRTQDLPMIAEFFLMFHRDKPVDWLLDHILWVKVCHPDKDWKHCDAQKALLRQRYKPSLFQHMGFYSSLRGKVQQLKDKDFEKQPLFQAHQNPAAELSSSLKHFQQHSLDRAYRGLDFFWALTPIQGDHILIRFHQPIHISGYLFRSGNIETSRDKFYNTTVEVLPSKVSTPHNSSHYGESDNAFIIIGAFENGVAEGEVEETLQPISALRLMFHSDSYVWALLSEILIKV